MDQINNVSLYNLTKFLSPKDHVNLGQVNKKFNSKMKIMPFFREINELSQTLTDSSRDINFDRFVLFICISMMYISCEYNILSSLVFYVFTNVIKRHFTIPSIDTFNFGIKINRKVIDVLLFLFITYQKFCLFCIPSNLAQQILYSSYLDIVGIFYYMYIVIKMKRNKYKKILINAISLYKNDIAHWIIESSINKFSLNDMKIIKAKVLYYDNDYIYELMKIDFRIVDILKNDSVRIFTRYIQMNPTVDYQFFLSFYKAKKIKEYLNNM